MGVRELVVRYFDKSYEHLSLREPRDAPVSAISGVSEAVTADLKQAFGIKTVGDFTPNKYIRAPIIAVARKQHQLTTTVSSTASCVLKYFQICMIDHTLSLPGLTKTTACPWSQRKVQ